MKRFAILAMIIALAVPVGLASTSMDDYKKYVQEEKLNFKIIGIDIDEPGPYSNGSLTVNVQNTGEQKDGFKFFYVVPPSNLTTGPRI